MRYKELCEKLIVSMKLRLRTILILTGVFILISLLFLIQDIVSKDWVGIIWLIALGIWIRLFITEFREYRVFKEAVKEGLHGC